MHRHPGRRAVEKQRCGEEEEVEAGDGYVSGHRVGGGAAKGAGRRDVGQHRSLWKRRGKKIIFGCINLGLVLKPVCLGGEVLPEGVGLSSFDIPSAIQHICLIRFD